MDREKIQQIKGMLTELEQFKESSNEITIVSKDNILRVDGEVMAAMMSAAIIVLENSWILPSSANHLTILKIAESLRLHERWKMQLIHFPSTLTASPRLFLICIGHCSRTSSDWSEVVSARWQMRRSGVLTTATEPHTKCARHLQKR